MEIFKELALWVDPVARDGPEAMAVDEWLLETSRKPVLRIYGWRGEWCSLGYFGSIRAAREAFPGVGLVRRWTGGGMVDHRQDWTYSVIAPQGQSLARSKGGESYRILHLALAAVLEEEGVDARMSGGDAETGLGICFENPVNHDLVGPDGRKLAGAGQRRSKEGLLHQGSVAPLPGVACNRPERLADRLCISWTEFAEIPDAKDLQRRIALRYDHTSWTERR